MLDGANWLVTNEGICQELKTKGVKSSGDVKGDIERPYRLYQFLADLDHILDRTSEDRERLEAICPLVRQLLEESSWLQLQYSAPDPNKGWSVSFLYDEPGYPLTVQMVAWAQNQVSKIHNHGTWGLVYLLDGEEKNILWRRVENSENRDRLEKLEEIILKPGDIMTFLPDAIHCVEALKPTVSFNLYGVTNYQQRYQFNIDDHTAKLF